MGAQNGDVVGSRMDDNIKFMYLILTCKGLSIVQITLHYLMS